MGVVLGATDDAVAVTDWSSPPARDRRDEPIPVGLLGVAHLPALLIHAQEPGERIEMMTLVSLEQRCYEEMLRYYRCGTNDGRYGYQLFRRAIVGREGLAWAAIERIYRGHLLRWARCHRLYRQADVEAEELANRALENLWRRVGPASFDAFPNLSSILGYLQRCVVNLVIDQARMRVREQQRAQALGQAMAGRSPLSPHGRALDRVRAEEIWETVRGLCRNEREQRLAYCYLVLGLKPSDILACCPEEFADTAAINGVLATLLKRLRRSPALHRLREEAPVA